MSDREKIIKGLECCSQMAGEVCRECPYANECEEGDGLLAVSAHLAADALSFLKAQELVRPGIGIIHNDDGSKSYFLHCPLDGTTLNEGDKYCRKCGRGGNGNGTN